MFIKTGHLVRGHFVRNVSYSKGTSCRECFVGGNFVMNVSYAVRGQVVGECFVGGYIL